MGFLDQPYPGQPIDPGMPPGYAPDPLIAALLAQRAQGSGGAALGREAGAGLPTAQYQVASLGERLGKFLMPMADSLGNAASLPGRALYGPESAGWDRYGEAKPEEALNAAGWVTMPSLGRAAMTTLPEHGVMSMGGAAEKPAGMLASEPPSTVLGSGAIRPFSGTAYHGSPRTDLTSISANPAVRQFDNGTSPLGAFVSTTPEGAAHYAGDAGKVYQTNVSLQNPYEMPMSEFLKLQDPTKSAAGEKLAGEQWGSRLDELKGEGAALRQKLQDAGHDGVIVRKRDGSIMEMSSFNDIPVGGSPASGGMLASEPPSITAYHASPHDFDKFDYSKIGTGEGGQAYGHGLYFAEGEPTMEMYHKFFQGRGADWSNPHNVAFDAVNKAGGDKDAALNGLLSARRAQSNQMGKVNPELDGAIDLLQSGAEITPNMSGPAHRYQVQINADPEHFLDWDSPMGSQSDHVKRALGIGEAAAPVSTDEVTAVMKRARERGVSFRDMPEYQALQERQKAAQQLGFDRLGMGPLNTGAPAYEVTGAQLYNGRRQRLGDNPVAVAEALREAGIPGIKYLDAGSRGKGDGTHNYVMFSDDAIKIMRKFGLAGLGLAGYGAAQSQTNSDNFRQ